MASPNPNRKQNVIVLKPRRVVRTIHQNDLEEMLLLDRQFSEAEKARKRKREQLCHALKAGAYVEDGIHTARVESYFRKGYKVPEGTCEKLIVK